MSNNCDDINPRWLLVARQMQGKAKSCGYSVVTIAVVCEADGTPAAWGEPKQTLVYPRALDKATILRLLTGGGDGSTI